ncbi:hypothetical protein Tco_1056362 [Tanacetum coccineum]|uniref:UBN2 domain-containing protein n=1 Tax=Tanacetum coccineum TaxID=301880 RepID=A0ABQ5H3R5_9ASTR
MACLPISQVKDNKIDLLVQQYAQFTILKEESIDNAFARFNIIITSLKALDEGFSSKNYVRKFLRALHPKWRAKNDSEMVKGKREQNRSLALKAKKESSDEDSSTSDSEDEEYTMAVRDFKKFSKKTRKIHPNHLIGECPKLLRNYNQRAFVGGSWSDSDEDEEEKTNDEKYLMAKASNKDINMPRATVGDTSLTRSYISKVSQTPGIAPSIVPFYKPIEDRCIHEGRVVDQLYYTSDHIDRCFSNICLNCLYEINEPIVPRFVLDFFSQVTLFRVILIYFMIQNEFITLSLQQFGKILRIPFDGQAVFTNEWDLGSLEYSQETEGPYHTDLRTPKEIHQFLQFQRIDPNRTIKNKTVILSPNQVLTKELRQDLKRWNKLIYKNVFGLGGHQDHLPACLDHILYCIIAEQQYNLAYFFVKRIEIARATSKAHLPYASTCSKDKTHRPRSDRGKARHSVSLTSAHHNHGSSSHQGDEDEDDGASRASYLNSSTSPPPRVPLPPPTQENASMDITLTLSPITPLDVQFDTPSPSPPIFGHPIPWNLLEAHGDSCLCCIHNRTLIFGLRDELQYMFSYIEHMLSQPPFSNTPPPSISPN